MVDAEGEFVKVDGARGHFKGASTDRGRTVGGYVVGKAWDGAGTDKRGQGFWWGVILRSTIRKHIPYLGTVSEHGV